MMTWIKKNELISVIVPNYNGQKTLELCLDAIFKQDYSNFETIFIDDMSSDNSVEIAKNYLCKIFSTEKNGGPAVARNLGARHAEGSILFFVDSDVALMPDALSVAIKKFRQDSQLGAVSGIYDKVPLIRDSLVEEYRALQDHYWKTSSTGYITTLSVADGAIKKDVFFEIGGFDQKLRHSEDIDFGQRISYKYKILASNEIVGKHDCDDTLRKILRTFYVRAVERVPLFIKRSDRFFKGYGTLNRAVGVVCVAACFFTLILGIVDIHLLVIPLLLFIAFLLSDIGQYLFVLRERGLPFLLYFICIYYLVNMSIFLGVTRGFLAKVVKK
ncbi:MAG: glycosyltransferase [Candidatus Omnitrophota bacterium]